ncbi:ubiquinol-cytochrome c reductase iron-sulfur subunit [Aquabacterium sp. G14]|uniref:ubiquinol-cytochrome c reductase iron-sulfur subunit n=1 Tax=Aquabacterium sp. G14 TaxID=3130164 RepID=UPI0030B444F5
MSDAISPDPRDLDSRRSWLKLTTAAGGVAAVATAIPFVSTLAPSERAKAQGAAVEVDIADLAPGAMKTVEWRGKPVWVVRRTPEMLAQLQGHDQKLADPASEQAQQPPYAQNATRSLKPEVFLAVGICTHLGCSPSTVAAGSGHPSVEADWPGGYFCPCHGSTFDGAGRVYKNKPAPTNLEIPPHRYVSATRILIGEDDAKA